MTTWERRARWEASLSDEARWEIETSGITPPVPDDFEAESNDEEESK